METAAQLISKRVVEAWATDRLASLSARLLAVRSSHCVVLDQDDRHFLGVVRLADIARWSDPGNRILADLVSRVAPMTFSETEPAEQVAALFDRHELGEAAVFSGDGSYLGLITAESVLKWSAARARAASQALQKAETQLASQSKVHSAFLAAVSHELRTPLNPAYLVASDRAYCSAGLSEDIRKDFELIAKSVAVEVGLIDNLLEVTKILSRRIELELKPIPVHEVLDRVIREMEPSLSSKELMIERNFGAAIDSVSADEGRLAQIFANILTNAAKFTPMRGRITVGTVYSAEDRTVEIEIRDTGVGMTAEELQRLFRPFSILEEAEVDSVYRHRGLGLGTAIAKNLVELHNGSIIGRSEGKGRGSSFVITLPHVEQLEPS